MFFSKQLLSLAVISAVVTFASAQARIGCSRNGTVQANDTCDILSARDNVSTYAACPLRKTWGTIPSDESLVNNQFPARQRQPERHQLDLHQHFPRRGAAYLVPPPSISTYLSRLSRAFHVQGLCLGLVGQDCSIVDVIQPGDSCVAIAGAAGIPVSTLLTNNPNVAPDCSNIYPGEVRRHFTV